MDDPIWISKELAIAIHKRQLAEHGGADGIRDEGLLAEHVLAGLERRFHERRPHRRVRGDVDNFNIVAR